MDSIKQTLEQNIHLMRGDWVLPKNNYEADFSNLLGWEDKKGRYADATNGVTDIEYKKGQGAMWFDMVRYAEIYKGIGTQNTITLFFRYDKKEKYVRDIYVIDTKKLLEYMKMDDELASFCIKLYKDAPRGLNMQMSATNTDMRNMATHIITNVKKRKAEQPLPYNYETRKEKINLWMKKRVKFHRSLLMQPLITKVEMVV